MFLKLKHFLRLIKSVMTSEVFLREFVIQETSLSYLKRYFQINIVSFAFSLQTLGQQYLTQMLPFIHRLGVINSISARRLHVMCLFVGILRFKRNRHKIIFFSVPCRAAHPLGSC